MIDLSIYRLEMSRGEEVDGVYTELRIHVNNGFQVYMVEPEIKLLQTFDQNDQAEQFIQNYFNN